MQNNYRAKNPLRSFRDLEIYQKSSKLAVEISQQVLPITSEKNFRLNPQLEELSLGIPCIIAEAFCSRYDNRIEAMSLLEKAMLSCNKMVVYLEQVRDIYALDIERQTCEDIIKTYLKVRLKTFNLLNAWNKFAVQDK